MSSPVRFPYTTYDDDPLSPLPRLSIVLHYGSHAIEVIGLLDTGATINVLPYSVGEALGLDWHEQPILPRLTGNLGQVEARGVLLEASHPQLTPTSRVRFAFAWSMSDNISIIFGQTNFFMEFEVCFFRAKGFFEIHPK